MIEEIEAIELPLEPLYRLSIESSLLKPWVLFAKYLMSAVPSIFVGPDIED